MPKPAIVLDRFDLQMLDVLQREGRITNAELAERVSLSPSACLRRLRALEASGVILDYRARLAGWRATGLRHRGLCQR
ncbi:MAG: winged helix-turn-helix transcriptional regulator [Actinobacteria bacterium]|nr:winged helix-turn-helix transcriptional regulator [Alphaproteobacteria bacterium]MBM4437891.1 winged helix-turn-helix transcriptional regulator [Actinomycetota bacterium]